MHAKKLTSPFDYRMTIELIIADSGSKNTHRPLWSLTIRPAPPTRQFAINVCFFLGWPGHDTNVIYIIYSHPIPLLSVHSFPHCHSITTCTLVISSCLSPSGLSTVNSGVAIQVASGAYAPPVSKIHNIFGMWSLGMYVCMRIYAYNLPVCLSSDLSTSRLNESCA